MNQNRSDQSGQRRDDKPALTLRFSTTAARQAFIDELLASLKTDTSKSPWRHVALWGCGR